MRSVLGLWLFLANMAQPVAPFDLSRGEDRLGWPAPPNKLTGWVPSRPLEMQGVCALPDQRGLERFLSGKVRPRLHRDAQHQRGQGFAVLQRTRPRHTHWSEIASISRGRSGMCGRWSSSSADQVSCNLRVTFRTMARGLMRTDCAPILLSSPGTTMTLPSRKAR